ncbi:MAG TPA: ferrochelatase [Gemmatimonadota bacterium]|nr:ferrochelatase [Gemmatimonadota bacterium]
MTTAVLVLNFGEPAHPVEEEVVPYLERIFLQNASLEHEDEEARARRSRELARRRAPGLIEEYRSIGGSPLAEQAAAQSDALEAELRRRGLEARTFVGMQFTEPSIPAAVERARAAGADRLVGLPVYPLCGRSTTVAALEEMAAAVRDAGWEVERHELTGWHRHPAYPDLRAAAIRRRAEAGGVDLADPSVRLVFSAHGTPLRYLDDGNRYDLYVDDYCRTVASRLGVQRWSLGFQNHGNRSIPWTEPEIDDVVRGLEGEASDVVVDPTSFMHEQSETLSELDVELREVAGEAGLGFHRVPVPHDDPAFAALLADLVQGVLGDGRLLGDAVGAALRACRCRASPGARCLNAGLERAAD